MPTSLEGRVRVEGTGPSPLRSRFLFQLSSYPALSSQEKPEPWLGKRRRVAAVPPPLSSPAPISSYQEPSGLPLLPSSSKSLQDLALPDMFPSSLIVRTQERYVSHPTRLIFPRSITQNGPWPLPWPLPRSLWPGLPH